MSAKKPPRQGTRAAPRAAIVPRRTPNGLAAAAGPLGEAGADMIAELIPGLWAVPAGWKLGAKVREMLGGKDTGRRLDLLRARVTGLALTVAEVRRIAAAAHGVSPSEFLDRLRDPDVLFVLQAARDHYALSQLQPRLRRFAAILADRIPRARAEDPIDDDLRFARAALDVDDEGMAFLARVAGQLRHAKARRAPEPIVPARVTLTEHAEARGIDGDEDALRIVAAVARLRDHHLVLPAGTGPGGGWTKSRTGRDVHFPDQALRLSVWGARFLDLVAAAGASTPLRDAESGPDPVPTGQ